MWKLFSAQSVSWIELQFLLEDSMQFNLDANAKLSRRRGLKQVKYSTDKNEVKLKIWRGL